MARKTVKAVDLAKAIQELLDEYGTECATVVEESAKEVADKAVSKLQSVARFNPNRNPSGDYSKDWTDEQFVTGRFTTRVVVFNQDHYRLTHLLENGHVSRNGTGRTFGRVKAYPHIAPVNDWAEAEIPRVVKERLK